MMLGGKEQELQHHNNEVFSGGGGTLPPCCLGTRASTSTEGSPPAITLKSQIEKEILDTMLEKEDDRISTYHAGTIIGSALHHHDLFLASSTSTGDHVCIDGGGGLRGTRTRVNTSSTNTTTRMTTQSLQQHQQQQETTVTTCSSCTSMEGKKHLFLSHSPVTVVSNGLSSHDDNDHNEKEFRLLDGMMGNLERFEICKWYYTVVDYYNFDRITVTMAMSYIDRVLWRKVSRLLLVEGIVRTNTTDTTSRTESRRNHQQDKNKSFLQLLAVASLYLAIKLFEKHYPIHNMLVDLVLMSKGKFSADEIIGMESYILKELEWNVVHVPVPQHFLHHLLKLAYVSFPAMNKSSANKIMNHANYFIEVVAFDNSFAQESASVIASAALLISIQQLLANDTYASDAIRATLEHTIMTRKPLPYSFCGGIMMSRMEIIQHVMERIDNFVTKHLHHGKEH